MGTSTSHPSPRTLGWSAVATGYTSSAVPLERVVVEVWRAAQSQTEPLEKYLSSPVVFKCQEAVRQASSPSDALASVSHVLRESKQNTVIAELAKRAAAQAFRSDEPVRAWRVALFAETADYLVSRDLPGYVGPSFRNSTLNELLAFKDATVSRVKNIVSQVQADPHSAREWRSYILRALARLTGEQ